MRICIDIDGVLCELRKNDETYSTVKPIRGAKEKLASLRAAGHYIILFTARHMKTCGGNVGLVMARQGQTTLQWLAKHGMEYDEIHFGKPHADIYIDDNALSFTDWDSIASDGSSLRASHETRTRHLKNK
jgi:capsule biosynthesis phosphatase